MSLRKNSLVLIVLVTYSLLVTAWDPTCVQNQDYFPVKIVRSHHDDFSIAYSNTYKVVTNFRANVTFVLYICGAAPADTFINTMAAKFFKLPLTTLANVQTVTTTFLEILGVRSRLRFLTPYTVSPCFRQMALQDSLPLLSESWDNATLLAQQVATVDAVVGPDTYSPDVKYIAQSATQDVGAFHRSEWILYISAFVGAEDVANRYVALSQFLFTCQAARANAISISEGYRPLVAWVSFSPSWVVGQSGVYEIFNASYKIDYLSNAGVTLLDPSVRKVYSAQAEFMAAIANVDILIDETFSTNSAQAWTNFLVNFNVSATTSTLKFVRNHQVYNVDKTQVTNPDGSYNGYDWLESAMARPDVVLKDLISIAHPENLPSYQRSYFRNIFNEQIVVPLPASCTNTSAPLLPFTETCVIDVPTVTPTPATTTPVTPKPAAKSASFSNHSNAILAVLVSIVFSLSTVIY